MNKNLSKLMKSLDIITENITLIISDISIRNLSYEYIIMIQFENRYHIGMRLNSLDVQDYEISKLVFIMNDYINIELTKLKRGEQ